MDRQYILKKLEEKKKLDPNYQEFGVSNHHYELQPPIEEKTLVTLEHEFSIDLPHAYREFLLNIGNGGAGPSYGLYSLQGALTEKDPTYDKYLGCKVGDEISQDFIRPTRNMDDYHSEDRGTIILCQHGCANDDYLVLNGNDKGTVWTMIEWVGHLVPKLKQSIDLAYINHMPEDQKETEKSNWIKQHLAANKAEQMSFNDWYLTWLESPPCIIQKISKRKRFFFW